MASDRYRLKFTRQAAKDLKHLCSWEERVRQGLIAPEADHQ
jgi:hypothetical protein